jgi:hypothetical protein
VYAYWQHINEDCWRLKDDQVELARAVLEAEHGTSVEIIDITPEDGISAMGFAMKEAVEAYGDKVAEIAMDSTCKSSEDIMNIGSSLCI